MVDLLVGLVLESTEAAASPRVVDEDVDRPPSVEGGIDHGLHRGLVGHVGGDGQRLDAELIAQSAGNRVAG